MELARFTRGQHSPDCSGCPACSYEMAARLIALTQRQRTPGEWEGAFRARIAQDLGRSAPPPPSLRDCIEAARTRGNGPAKPQSEPPRVTSSVKTAAAQRAPEPPSLAAFLKTKGGHR